MVVVIRTRITAIARQRGLTAAEVARRLGLYPSNLSAMDAGARSISLQALTRVAKLLDCSPGDLLEVSWAPETPLFRGGELIQRLEERDFGTSDGAERGWVHAALLAWQRHHRSGASRR